MQLAPLNAALQPWQPTSMHLAPHFEPIGPKSVVMLLHRPASISASASNRHFRSHPELVLVNIGRISSAQEVTFGGVVGIR